MLILSCLIVDINNIQSISSCAPDVILVVKKKIKKIFIQIFKQIYHITFPHSRRLRNEILKGNTQRKI